ncbi:2-hydroxyacyl-CoA dehydratase family protein [Microbacterium sp. STN6]|uniref:2-hydroxyacyl-CoA dehydratase family protein n=1 Tax=Microbacterium sp. STN6 TaxID=2995588 RepID=UPI002260931A|nr:2-hydroxyacyl-CoA dehydratase family protein [Microbacterium sp. STN6]MCX7520704.1 2-hydroxyacyl-CoA dehydratase family protein [Microbacterium sp. STN6]
MTSELERAARDVRSAVAIVAASGRPVIGIVGRDVPAVLVAASGAHPYRIAPGDELTDEADAVMGRAVDRAASRVLAAVMAGSLDFLRGILVSRDCEASVRLFYTLQELHRRGAIAPPVHLVDQVHQNRESTLQYNVAQLATMWEMVEAWASGGISTRSIEAARNELADVRGELERRRSWRRSGRLSGTAALHGYRVAAALPPTDAARLLRDAGSEADDAGFPVFLTGSAPLGDEVYRAIEGAGARVVGEDHDWGDPILTDRLPARIARDRDSLLRELATARLAGAPAAASSTMAARAKATREAIAASGARALLSVVRPHDEAPAWDWRHQREQADVAAAMVRGEAADDLEQVVAVVETLRAAS